MTQLAPSALNNQTYNADNILEGNAVLNGDGTYTFTVAYQGTQVGPNGAVKFSGPNDATEAISGTGTYYGITVASGAGTLVANTASSFLVGGIGYLVAPNQPPGSGYLLVFNAPFTTATAPAAGTVFTIQPLGPNNTYQSVACFAAGTRIATARGDVLVENLAVGDKAITPDGDAGIVWIGHRRIDCRRHPRPQDVRPVRIRAHAFAPQSPQRDLRLSPDHCVFIVNDATGPAGALVPVRHLVNGTSVVQEAVDSVTYFHVELPGHAILRAENLPVESYLDTGNRAAFANAGVVGSLHADFRPGAVPAASCAPMVTGGDVLASAAALLHARAEAAHPLARPDGHVDPQNPAHPLRARRCQ